MPDFIVSSPARRAKQTAAEVARSSGFSSSLRTDAVLYDGGDTGIGAVVRALPVGVRRALVVGHDPAISRFLQQLTDTSVSLPPGGLAEIDLDADSWSRFDASATPGRLRRLWRPREASGEVSLFPRPHHGQLRPSKWLEAGADEPVRAVAQRAVSEKLDHVLDRLAAVAARATEPAAAEDGDAVRKLRVATRRAEAALRAFRDVLPRRATDRVREQLRSLRKATNAVRDDDVVLARLRASAPPEVLAALSADRRAAQASAHALFLRLAGDAGLAKSAASLRRKIQDRAHDDGAAHDPFGIWARERLTRSTERFFASEPSDLAAVEGLHDLRLRAKKLRYEVELLAAVLPSHVKSVVHPALTELQERLGAVSDDAIAVRRLRDLAGATEPPGTAASFAVLLAEADAVLERSRTDLEAWWTPARAEGLQSSLRDIA
jgi:CHAD domain-containing protein